MSLPVLDCLFFVVGVVAEPHCHSSPVARYLCGDQISDPFPCSLTLHFYFGLSLPSLILSFDVGQRWVDSIQNDFYDNRNNNN